MAQLASAQTAEVALVADTAKTVVQVQAAANHGIKIKGWGVSFDGTSVTNAAVVVDLLRQTTGGTMSALTPVKWMDSNGDGLDTTAQHTATGEPTAGDILMSVNVHPQTMFFFPFPIGMEPDVGAGDYLGIRCNAPGAAVNVLAFILFEE